MILNWKRLDSYLMRFGFQSWAYWWISRNELRKYFRSSQKYQTWGWGSTDPCVLFWLLGLLFKIQTAQKQCPPSSIIKENFTPTRVYCVTTNKSIPHSTEFQLTFRRFPTPWERGTCIPTPHLGNGYPLYRGKLIMIFFLLPNRKNLAPKDKRVGCMGNWNNFPLSRNPFIKQTYPQNYDHHKIDHV